jgi:hypothetical protein
VILQENHYYPYGKEIVTLCKEGNPEHDFKYNGIEKSEEFNWNNYTAQYRSLSEDFPRWGQVDPKPTYEQSPYMSMGGNPLLYSDFLGDTIRISDKMKEDRATFRAYNIWKYETKEGKRFHKLYGEGGKFGHVTVNFDVENLDAGTKGETSVFAINKENGEKTKLIPQNSIDQLKKDGQNVDGLRSHLKAGESLEFNITLDKISNGKNLGYSIGNKVLTTEHEKQHVGIMHGEMLKYGKIVSSPEEQHQNMKNNPHLINQRIDALKIGRPDLKKTYEELKKSVNSFSY